MADIRTIIFWLIGTTCIFFGSLIAGSVAPVVGSTGVSITMAYGLAFCRLNHSLYSNGLFTSFHTYNVGWNVLDINSYIADGRRGIIS